MFGNMKLAVRLGLGFSVSLLLLLVMSVVSYTQHNAVQVAIDSVIGDRFPKTVQANQMIGSIHIIAMR